MFSSDGYGAAIIIFGLICAVAGWGGYRIHPLAVQLYSHFVRGLVMSNWIRCSERMPDDGQNVIAFDGDVLDGITFDDGVFTCDGYDPFDRIVVENITHWQPLPEPPKEGE